MKRFERTVIFITTILVSLMAMIMLISAETGDITVKVNGKTIRFPDQSPVVQNERTLVPVRFVAEALGYDVIWNQADKSAVIDDGKFALYDKLSEKAKKDVDDGYGVVVCDLESQTTICKFNMENFQPTDEQIEALAEVFLLEIIEFFKDEKNVKMLEECKKQQDKKKT